MSKKPKVAEPELRDDDGKTPMERLRDMAKRVVSVSPKEMQKREQDWKRRKGSRV